jgi:hypothetical protein
MTLDELLQRISDSDGTDWYVMACWGVRSGPSYRDQLTAGQDANGRYIDVQSHTNVAAYKPDIAITMAWGLDAGPYQEKWSEAFPDPETTRHYLDIFYSGALVFREAYISVDGGRAYLPGVPRMVDGKMVVNPAYRAFMRKFNDVAMHLSDFESAFQRAGMTVGNVEWPTSPF